MHNGEMLKMKRKILTRLIIASIVTSTVIALTPVGASAAWVKNYYSNWSYTEGNGYATGWRLINGIWYLFDDNGEMRTGWIEDDGESYYIALNGEMQTGVIQIEGNIYLFSESGALQKGNCIVDEKVYTFNDNGVLVGDDSPTPTKAFDYYGNTTIAYSSSQIVDEDASMSSDIPSDGTTQVTQYKVKFKDPDADEELLKTKTVDEDTVITLYEPTKSDYSFVEWNTKSNGEGTSYDYDDTIKIKKNTTLYAQWEDESDDDTDDDDDDDDIEVTSIAVSSTSGLYVITSDGGTLQMTKVVSPSDATTQTVTWSVSNGTGEATISSTGKLTAVSDGTVTVNATATDGSGIVGTIEISISNQ
jgi:uncharacterized repeat protein (TIGR02543 family)